ncbi:MAG: DUF881 domain-containing protein [Pseudonocardiaceae bacterium]|nr:DUF881 domain-containing protein [Pseudonocardiaceae bacterium]
MSTSPGTRRRSTRRRRSRALSAVLITVLCLGLGLGIATQVQRTRSGDALADSRPQDLVVLLDGLQEREAALREDIAESEAALRRLRASGDTSAAALGEARARAGALAVLAGTVPVAGPGVELVVTDPGRQVGPETLLDVLQELRGAGAEAVQVGDVRIGVDAAFTGVPGSIALDGRQLAAPYRIRAIGDPSTLAAALNIPGGVVDTVRRGGGDSELTERDRLEITALRPLTDPQYARPAN